MEPETAIDQLSETAAKAELARLAEQIAAANRAYHTLDDPEISDADYDRLPRDAGHDRRRSSRRAADIQRCVRPRPHRRRGD